MEKERNNELEASLEKQSNKKIFLIVIVLILVITLIFFGVAFYLYFKSPEHKLNLGANIENFTISENEKTAYIKLAGESDKNITKIKFVFKDAEGQEYIYETSEGASEISVSFKRGFWQWLFGKSAYEGKYDYEINASDVNLNNFNNINEVSVLFEYETETGETIKTPKLDTTKTTTAPAPSPGGGGGPSGPSPCTPDKDCPYYYNLGQCGSGLNDGCNNILDCNNCDAGEICVNNSCVALPSCTSDANCTNLTRDCGIGVCNLTSGNCYINYLIGSICGSNVSECDEVEYCQDGLSDCPIDVNKTDGTACSIGACQGGVCSGGLYGYGRYGEGSYIGSGSLPTQSFIGRIIEWFKKVFSLIFG